MGVVRAIELDPVHVIGLRVVGHTVFVEDDETLQAIAISGRDLDALHRFVTGLADALGTLTLAADAEGLTEDDVERYDRELDWRASV